ncbi:MAG: alpha/beta hydrolase [Proteobacteria bacterium]|nr:alpha/beta hydrolase [Pseudomonadota bacterium]
MRLLFLMLAALLPSLAHAAAQTATINGAQISYEICGDEKAQGVVLLHDGLANSALWDGVWPALCKQYRVVRYDRRGYGKSPPAKDMHAPTDDLYGVMKLVGLDHAHIIGSSAGAGLAVDFVFDQPEAIDKLVLVAPSVSGYQPTAPFVARLRRIEEVVVTGDMDRIVEVITTDPAIIWPGNDAARKKLEAILRANPHDLGAHPRQRRPFNMALRLPEVYAPALVIVGASDDPYN